MEPITIITVIAKIIAIIIVAVFLHEIPSLYRYGQEKKMGAGESNQ